MPNPASEPTNASLYTGVLGALKELLPRNYIGGLICSNDADAAHDVNIAVGECRGLADDASLRLTTEITKQIDAVWALGDDAGGLDAGAVAADTMYGVWLIKRSDTGVVDALISTSFTAPNMPANYDKKRLIGAVCTDGASDVIAFTQSGDYFRYTGDIVEDIDDDTIVNDVHEAGTLSVPPSGLAHVYGYLINPAETTANGYLYIRTKDAADGSISDEAFAAVEYDADNFRRIAGIGMVLVTTTREIEYAASETQDGSEVHVSTIGFWMPTRREP